MLIIKIVYIFLILFLVYFTGCKNNEEKTADAKPNIILILVDDQVISSFNTLPKIQSDLIGKGIFFKNTFCASPVCAPSRASILTGQYPHNHGEETNGSKKFVNNRDKDNTIATILKNGGYKNVFIGKYTHGYNDANYVPPGWYNWYALLGGAPGYYDYIMSANGKPIKYDSHENDYSTDVISKIANNFILNNKDPDRPFFMYIAPFAPHSPRTPAPRHANYHFEKDSRPPFYESDISDKPKWVQDHRKFYPLHDGEKRVRDGTYKLNSLLAVDEMIDKLIKNLAHTGKLDNTYIFYLADNGDDFSTHVKATGKLLPYEEGVRTPLVVRVPGINHSVKHDHLVSTVDLLPTIIELAGLDMPSFVDGRSMVPLLSSEPLPESEWRKRCYVELGDFKSWYQKAYPPRYQLIRGSAYKYIEYATGEKEFYDLRVDPKEMTNSYDSLSSETRHNLNLQLRRLSSCKGRSCRDAEAISFRK